MKISGLDKLTKQAKEAERLFAEIDGELGSVEFDPDDPSSIEMAISNCDAVIEKKFGEYRNNPLVEPFIDQMKNHFREAIVEKARLARLSDDGKNFNES